jgi:hypothetical protein
VRKVSLLVVAVLAAAILALSTGAASAEGHHCRHWYPDPYYGGYWLWLDCGPTEEGRWPPNAWHSDLPWYEWDSEYLDIREPLY